MPGRLPARAARVVPPDGTALSRRPGRAYDPRMRRVVIVGNSASGKTTLARALAARLGVAHIELDALFHGPGWTPTPPQQFCTALHLALDGADRSAGGWVVCGNYSEVRAGLWARADTIVWLDLPRSVVMRQVIGRTVRRTATRAELWNGNRESWRGLVALHDPEASIIRWSWDGVGRYRTRYSAVATDPLWAGLGHHRLTSPGQVRTWLSAVPIRPGRHA